MLKWKLQNRSPTKIATSPKQQKSNKMPSRVSFGSLLERDLRRQSLDNVTKRSRTNDENKENQGIYFTRSPLANNSFTALQNLSNGMSPKAVALRNGSREFPSTLPTFRAEYSPLSPLAPKQQSYKRRTSFLVNDDSMSSSRIGDVTLDKMLDAIIASAKKEVTPKNRRKRISMDCLEEDFEPSIHEMEVKTPPLLKRQKVVRRKPKAQQKQEMIGLTLPNGIPSPETPKPGMSSARNMDQLANMDTPQDIVFVVNTSTPEHTLSTKRCLSYSPNSDDDFVDAKRSSVASSNISAGSRAGPIKGSLDMAIFVENGKLNVHVIRCRELQRSNGSTAINAYVKVALISADETPETGFQRTAVHRNSSRPYFDHCFKFDIQDEQKVSSKRLQLAVWHRDRNLKRSEFLGCISFPVRNAIKTAISGSYRLQSQSCLTNPQNTAKLNSATCDMTDTKNAINRQKSVEEDVMSIDSVSAAVSHLLDAHTGQPILSKKAIHQRDADENLFLRFLELDPPPAEGDSSQGSGSRRMSTFKPNVGRTPFTITKKLSRTTEKGFGFSIVWTHPPRVEKVEPGMSADKNGIYPGDYVIFVDKHNVVTMPEADVLNLIRSQGNCLTLEIFRRSGSSGAPALSAARSSTLQMNGVNKSAVTSMGSNVTMEEMSPAIRANQVGLRPTTACSGTSIEMTKRRLNLPQVTFSKESIAPNTDHRRRFLLQLVSREQNFVTALHFGMQRFVQPLQERKDLISPNDHRTLFQNIDELQRISEDILEQLVTDDQDPQLNFTSRVYLSKTTAICAAYKKYCNGIKRADCVLVNKSRQPGSEFVAFITEPQVPRKRPDLTMLIHRPLQHFREILKLMQLLSSYCHIDSEEHRNFASVINELQAAYREITVGGGLMEPLGEGRPLLTLQDLESRMVFTRCKPFTLAIQGRQWIFGGDLSRVEGRSVKPYWTLLFSDIIIFAKVSRDRVLFITEEPIQIANVVDSCFNIRKKNTEFRLTVDPNGRFAESPTGYCAPDLTKTPKRNARRKSLILRAPSLELKAVWQNLLQRQIFLVNAALGSTPLSSPLDSPDVLNTIVPLSDFGPAPSIASIKLSSADSINQRNQQQQRNSTHKFDQLIDEKCRILNKTGTPKGSALHLANWMKGQLDKQQEKARFAAVQSPEGAPKDAEYLLFAEDDKDERITYWTKAQLEKRTKELNLAKEDGSLRPMHPHFGGKRLSGVEELGLSDHESERKSASRSTTSDSQVTVRSSPIGINVIDKLSVCHHCHKNCQQKSSHSPPLLSNSLKVQHSQASPHRCCQVNGAARSSISSTSSTVTGNPSSNDQCCGHFDDHELLIAEVSPKSTVSTAVHVAVAGDNLKQHPTSSPSVGKKSEKGPSSQHKNFIPCNCKCNPEDFLNTTMSPDELKQETCKIIPSVPTKPVSPRKAEELDPHKDCKCVCKNMKDTIEDKFEDDISLVLIGLAQLNPAAKLLKAESFVPTIAVVPPTPDSILSKTTTNIWDNTPITGTATQMMISNIPRQAVIENIPEDSPEESPQDEELPYQSMTTPLRRYGTMSSLERLPSEDMQEDQSEPDDEDVDDEDDIEVITREVFDDETGQPGLKTWTTRAGSYVAGKMSFFEESRAFIDKYLGRWNQEQEASHTDDDQADECTSGATSGEEVWGTPTSGGDNDDLHMLNSDQTQSSPTKSSASYNDDDDTELMMDELLMAPPMTASSIRGLLPRRRLEPLFEEETESDEEKTQQESEDFKKGETAANGHDLEDSTGSSSDEEEASEENSRSSNAMPNSSMPNAIMPSPIRQNIPESLVQKDIPTTMTMATTVTTIMASSSISTTIISASSSTSQSTTSPKPPVRKAKFSPPPPPPRRLLLTQTNLNSAQQQTLPLSQTSGNIADIGCLVDAPDRTIGIPNTAQYNQKDVSNMRNSVVSTVPVGSRQSIATEPKTETTMSASTSSTIPSAAVTSSAVRPIEIVTEASATKEHSAPHGSGLSPRLEMRLALNHDILGDEDLICYDPGPDLTTILGHDLSTFHRLTGRDLLNRSATNRVQPKEAVISFSQQRNSKMDTPTVNRRRQNVQQHQHQNRNTWSSSAFVDQIGDSGTSDASNKTTNSSKDESKLSGLELLAKREKIYCMSLLKSGSPARTPTMTTTRSTTSMGTETENTVGTSRTRKIGRDETALMETGKGNRLVNFLTRRNSENHLAHNCSQHSLNESNGSITPDRRQLSPRKDNDKTSLNRRFWKQITKRRRSNSASEISATS